MFEIFSVSVNPIAIILAALVYILFGVFWYSDLAFGKTWKNLVGKSSENLKMTKVQIFLSIITAFLLSTGLNSILQYSAMLSGLNQWVNIFATAFMTATTISATTMLNSVIWEGKRIKLFALNYLHQLISYVLVCAVLSLFFTV